MSFCSLLLLLSVVCTCVEYPIKLTKKTIELKIILVSLAHIFFWVALFSSSLPLGYFLIGLIMIPLYISHLLKWHFFAKTMGVGVDCSCFYCWVIGKSAPQKSDSE